jgi:hypothetical protein
LIFISLLSLKDIKAVKMVRGPDGEWWSGSWQQLSPLTGKPIPMEQQTMSVADMHTQYNKGFTVLINKLDLRVQAVANVCSSLESWLGIHTNANLYFTPPYSQGFESHWDWMEAVIMQVSGSKKWKLTRPLVPLSRPDQKWKPKSTHLAERESVEVLLQPGDVLWLPRGVIHEAQTQDSASMHITIGILVKDNTWEGLLHILLSQLQATPVVVPDESRPELQVLEIDQLRQYINQNIPSLVKGAPNIRGGDLLHCVIRQVAATHELFRAAITRPQLETMSLDAFGARIGRLITCLHQHAGVLEALQWQAGVQNKEADSEDDRYAHIMPGEFTTRVKVRSKEMRGADGNLKLNIARLRTAFRHLLANALGEYKNMQSSSLVLAEGDRAHYLKIHQDLLTRRV